LPAVFVGGPFAVKAILWFVFIIFAVLLAGVVFRGLAAMLDRSRDMSALLASLVSGTLPTSPG